jgi:hypothetical protein
MRIWHLTPRYAMGSHGMLLINLDEGRIENWPQGKTLSFHNMKACDDFIYILLDADSKRAPAGSPG